MKILLKSRRYRLSEIQDKKLELLKKYNVKESLFVRQAIDEKFERDMPKIIAEVKRIENLVKCPF